MMVAFVHTEMRGYRILHVVGTYHCSPPRELRQRTYCLEYLMVQPASILITALAIPTLWNHFQRSCLISYTNSDLKNW